ncbi:DNA cytosine methyltransferase [Lysinibacillus sphaericus]|uniref:Cytosine-specific methyltransferase n=1 Tax=Lysinibacillus sphaericus OT4b.31 TaxID=1285586 RepID=R7ZBL0_LYSSH|nr:DNA cytosine methyltransferase [Lysinibacillus sphaericus]EON71488.1 DNA-cytosine methyltransferase [Lysinibacillus sphaericus OT4b.31]
MKVVDLFCGAGGFSEGFERAGFEIIKAYDIWTPAILTHNMNHGDGKNPALKRDVFEISMLDDDEFEKAIPDSEVIIGSPPCVSFSNSNNSGKADKTNGIKLINAFLRIVARKMFKPKSKLKYWVMENVANSEIYMKNEYSMEDLECCHLGDHTLIIPNKKVYNMKYFGVPTNRKRFICGKYPQLNNLNDEENLIVLEDIFNALGSPNPDGYLGEKFHVIDPTYKIKIKSSELTDHHYIKEIPEFEWKKAKRQKEDKGYMGKMAFPENEKNPARTIMATLSASSRESMIFSFGENRYRYPTIREVATLMSFPIDFRFYGESDTAKYRMVGNAVTPKFAYEIAKCIREENFKNREITDKFSIKKVFNEHIEFKNLNGNIFPLKIEKEKKADAKFCHHVPYLIENAYRVELSNSFELGEIYWRVKIHYSQGKNAKLFENVFISIANFNEELIFKMYRFVKDILLKISNSHELQINYSKTTKDRAGLMGPDELLLKVKEFVNYLDNEEIHINEIGKKVSIKIAVAYFLLTHIINKLNTTIPKKCK